MCDIEFGRAMIPFLAALNSLGGNKSGGKTLIDKIMPKPYKPPGEAEESKKASFRLLPRPAGMPNDHPQLGIKYERMYRT